MDFQADIIDRVIKNAIQVMENSKYQMFEILDTARTELVTLNQELQSVLKETAETIEKVDQLEMNYRRSRIRLTEVSRDFVRYSEEDIKQAYEKATQLQLDVMIFREKEMYLKARRDDLQKRAKSVEASVERAETIGSQMGVVLEYLSGELGQVTRIIESAKNRQFIGLKIILAQEEERKRISREIHDGPAQLLAHLVLRTEIVERMIAKQEFKMVQDEIVDLKKQVRSSLEEMRKVIFNLRPMALDDLGLIPTLRKYVQDFEEKTKIRSLFETRGKEHRLSSAMEAAIYRLIQEALTNAAKHAYPTYVLVEITYQAQLVKIVVQDNGLGFKPELFQQKSKDHGHFGLIGMRERVELLEGRMEIESAENQGTKIVIHIPTNVEKGKE
ncbi:sensor histidine kinase [Paenibacillus sp. SEL3]|uniref:Signal transduction histidine-protein kinase/phosphatase DegS n=4 Tax=Paenibacillus TaxID=44249 RepID=A0A074LBY4_PAEPO|nr:MULTISPECIES: sensor histidine kinase [Paenibacillus]KAF6634839.1 sensor histidine kinase [Paenibacillus sp. EKM208P]MBP1173389.1 two-component system sensor histidine kinase DegS [Paenibacillus sp. PvR133]MCP3745880.1 sensor histidine kinase [Paenibacillus sp. A3M_27_13]MCP3778057.1 sensor histidine kinase [Paenibacillus sp. MZ03-122A]MCP3794858.1 sensor histidine kinase [Paenibacillus sp. CH40]MCP3807930.1 sensor histidine kinase [Paenibacillus sp. Lou8.1]MXO76654.1 histidine kinase [Pa